MTGIRIAVSELRRLSSGTLPKIALVALVLVPLLYASFYLYANYAPYDRLGKLPAAVVDMDTGATGPDGAARNVGAEVTGELLGSDSFQWHEVDQQQAQEGVRDGDYAFAIGIPDGFSSALLSSGQFTPRQATITLTTNDANNYLSGMIADKVSEQIRATIAQHVGTEAANRFLMGFSTIYGKLDEAHRGAEQLADGAQRLVDGEEKLVAGTDRLSSGSAELATGLGTLAERTATLPEQSRALADGASEVAAGNQRIADAGSAVADGSADLQRSLDNARGQLAQRLRDGGLSEQEVQHVLDVLGQLRQPIDKANIRIQDASAKLDTLASGARQVADGAAKLAATAPALTSGIGSAADGATQLREGAQTLSQGQQDALRGATQLADGAIRLRDGLAAGLQQVPNPDENTRSATADTIGDPVAVQSAGLSSAGSYGEGLAPFFIGLATWIGAFVLFLLLRPLSERAITGGAAPWRVALGGWLSAAALGAAQVVVLFAAITWLVGIDVAHPVAAIGFAMLTSLTFTAIVHALNALFGAVGKFIALVLLVLQLVSAGGTFPWQTLPEPLYPLHAALPMGYVIDGLRHLLYSGASTEVLGDVGVLAAYLLVALAGSVFAAYRHRMWTVSRLKPELAL